MAKQTATVHYVVEDAKGKITMPSGKYRLACDPDAVWAKHMTGVLQAATCEVCKDIGEGLESAKAAAARVDAEAQRQKAYAAMAEDVERLMEGVESEKPEPAVNAELGDGQ